MENSQVSERVIQLVQSACAEVGADTVVGIDTRLGVLSVDSLKLVEIIYQLETGFSVQADEDLLSQLETVGDVVAMFEAALQKQLEPA